jgi:hypothetical protein
VTRYYCADAGKTFSLLPDCLAARLGGGLDEVEAVVVHVEQSPSVEAAASELRPDIELPGAKRWVSRRKVGVHRALVALRTAAPGVVSSPRLLSIRADLGTSRALVALRGIGKSFLHALPHPLGFLPGRGARAKRESVVQHEMGADPA